MKDQLALFQSLPEPPQTGSRINIKLKPLVAPIWTSNKARLIECYLRYFVYVTKHGTYIDGFSGPQEPGALDAWSAKLVLECEPWRLRNFFLCELDLQKVSSLQVLVAAQRARKKGDPKRMIKVLPGNFNAAVDEVLASGVITEKEATFCLLDQRTFECDWATVEKLAKHKKLGTKIELFYFLAAHWFVRSARSKKDPEDIERWWGALGLHDLSIAQ